MLIDAWWDDCAGLRGQLNLVVEQRVRLLLCEYHVPQLEAKEAREKNHGDQTHVPGSDPDESQVRLIADVCILPAFVDHLQLRQVLKEYATVLRELPLVGDYAGLKLADSQFSHLCVEIVQSGAMHDLKLHLDHIVQLFAQFTAEPLSLLMLMCRHLQGENVVRTRALP